AALDREERRRRGLDRARQGPGGEGSLRFQRRRGGVRGPAEGGHPRSHQGRPDRTAERGVSGEPAAHHRSDGGGEARGEGGGPGHASGRDGGHGRHDVTPVPTLMWCIAGTRADRPGACFYGGFLTATPTSSSVTVSSALAD